MTRDLPYSIFGQDVILNPGCQRFPGSPAVGRVTKWPSAAAGAVVGGGAERGGRRQKRRRQARAGLLLSSAASATLPPPRFPSVEKGSNPRSETGRAPEKVEIRRSTSLTSCIASPPNTMSRRLRPGKTVNQRAAKTTLCELRNSGFAASRPTTVSP